MNSGETITGEISGVEAGCVCVRLDDGDTELCRGAKELHRKWGFFQVPVGQRVRISGRWTGEGARPQIVEILND